MRKALSSIIFLLTGLAAGIIAGRFVLTQFDGGGGKSLRGNVDILQNRVYAGGFVEGELVRADGNFFTLKNGGDELRISSKEGVTVSPQSPTAEPAPILFSLAEIPPGTVLRGSVTFTRDDNTGEITAVGRALVR